MLSNRYANDGIIFERLNETQLSARESFLKKYEGGVYKTQSIRCDCGSEDMELLACKDRYGLPVQTGICKSCGLVRTNPMLTQESLNLFYDDEYRPLYVGKEVPVEAFFADQYAHGERIYKFLKERISFSAETRVLEIGTGAGGILKAIADHENASVTGIDLGGAYVSFGAAHGLELYQMNSAQLAERSPHTFDVIILSHVLEHFLNLGEELKAIKTLLKDGGCLYVEVPGIKDIPNTYRDFMGFLQNAHVRHFTLDTLSQTLGWYGFEKIDGNEMIQSVFRVGKTRDRQNVTNYYEENLNFLRRLERSNFLLIHVRYPLARVPLLHKIYEILTGRRVNT